MVVRIELDDPSIGWTQYGPSEYIPEKMKQWLVKYIWNRDQLSTYERPESLYIVGPSKIGKTDTCYNLLNKDGKHCKVFAIDTYTNWGAFHDYIEENGLPDFVLVDDINVNELGREWKNLFGAQKTITYALTSTKKVTIDYGRPCIYLCNPDSDIFYSDEFKFSKKSWLKDNLFGGKPIYLNQSFINGASVKKYNKFAGDIKCEDIDPAIRKYIDFGSKEFESFPQPIQDRLLNKAIQKYMTELEDKVKYRKAEADYIESYRNKSAYDCVNFGSDYESATTFNNSAFDHDSLGNQSFYYSSSKTANDINDTGFFDEFESSESSDTYESLGNSCGNTGEYKSLEDEDIGKAADEYVKWYKENY